MKLLVDNEFDPVSRQHVCNALVLAQSALAAGALLTISGNRVRLHRLPIVPEA